VKRITTFRGVGGEMVYSFVHPKIFPTLIVLVLMWFMVLAPMGALLDRIGVVFPSVVVMCLFALLSGRFALPVAQGHFSEGLFTVKTHLLDDFLFAFRYLFLLVLACIPLYFLTKFVFEKLSEKLMFGVFSPQVVIAEGGVYTTALIILLVAWVLAPNVVLLVSTATSSLSEALSLKPFLWVVKTRFPDFVFFHVALIGGMGAFYIVYLIPIGTIGVVLSIAGSEYSEFVLTLMMLLPVAASPVLAGRLAGAFVYGTDFIEKEEKGPSPREVVQAVQEAIKRNSDDVVDVESVESAEIVGPSFSSAPIQSLRNDPSDDLVKWVRESLRSYGDVDRGHLFLMGGERGEDILTLGLELSQDAKLGARQQVIRELGPKLKELAGEKTETKIYLLDEDSLAKVSEVGLRVYQRK